MPLLHTIYHYTYTGVVNNDTNESGDLFGCCRFSWFIVAVTGDFGLSLGGYWYCGLSYSIGVVWPDEVNFHAIAIGRKSTTNIFGQQPTMSTTSTASCQYCVLLTVDTTVARLATSYQRLCHTYLSRESTLEFSIQCLRFIIITSTFA